MSDHQTRTLADALADAEIVRVEELNSSGEWVDRADLTHHIARLDRAAKVIAAIIADATACGYDFEGTCDTCRADSALIVKALDAAGLLVSPERDVAVAAKALREAADDMDDTDDPDAIHVDNGDIDKWLRARADRIEREAGESDADA